MRAEESLRSDRLINDPYAAAFVAAAPPLFPDVPGLADDAELAALIGAGLTEVAVRTRFFDDFLAASCASAIRQVVLLAAGLDTRAFRMNWPDGVQLLELDLPDLFTFKERVLVEERASPRCARHVVPVDLRENWPKALLASEFDPTQATAWVAEGLLVYLTDDDAQRLLTLIGDLSVPDSRLSFDHDVPHQDSTLRQAREMDGMAEVSAMWQGGLANHPALWLAEHGWNAETVARSDAARAYGRELANPTGAFFTGVRE